MALRLQQSQATGLVLAKFVEAQPETVATLHPGLESSPDHTVFQRDFTGSCGLFGFVLTDNLSQKVIDEAANNLSLFHIGASWGGFESLITQAILGPSQRQFDTGLPKGYLMRIYAGLEDQDDLLSELAHFFSCLRA